MTDGPPVGWPDVRGVCVVCNGSFAPLAIASYDPVTNRWSHPACLMANGMPRETWTCTGCAHANPAAATHCSSCGRRRDLRA